MKSEKGYKALGRDIIDEAAIINALAGKRTDSTVVREILEKARSLKGLDYEDIVPLAGISDPGLLGELFETATYIKERIYGKRLVIFAPLYVSNLCKNDCLYCAFRTGNKEVKRRALTQDEIARETEILVNQGHKRVLLVAGESYPNEGFQYILNAIKTIYSGWSGRNQAGQCKCSSLDC
jgi:2-iminoacetate synthase